MTASSTMASAATIDQKMALLSTDEAQIPVWRHFFAFTDVPRPSGHEERVVQMLKDFADQRGLVWKQDAIGNIVIKRPGSGGGESAPSVVIQNHVDMVTEANSDSTHDFMKDPIKLLRDGDWIHADGTTLGADNGVGAATALALLDMPKDAKLPPIEGLFTIDEERGLTGAFELDPSLIEGRMLLNLDTEDWGVIFIGCAGGGDSKITLPVTRTALPSGAKCCEVAVTGLLGGHSGLNIHEGRGNAVQMLAEVLAAISRTDGNMRVASVDGGDKRNAIAREARAVIAVEDPAAAAKVAEKCMKDFRLEYGTLEAGLSIAATEVPAPDVPALDVASTGKMLALLRTLPHGVAKMSHSLPNLVETSNNVAAVKEDAPGGSSLIVTCATRSSVGPALETLRGKIKAIAELCGAECVQEDAYPGWQPNPNSTLLSLAKSQYQELLGREPGVEAIHAGLECGIIGEKIPGIEMISMGPSITGAHSPDERVCVPTVKPFWDVTLKLLEKLADVKA
ncbi:unnamed protein product [Pedinophyceae sp. YPF-701]|nr:unnamed protein product [Pedinophyceae sp. YPF-701]